MQTPAELALTQAMYEVEKLPPSVILTDAVIKLQEARNSVADFVDQQEETLAPANTLEKFLSQYAKGHGSTEVRVTVYPNAHHKDGRTGICVYAHFVGIDADSLDAFVNGNTVTPCKPSDVTFG